MKSNLFLLSLLALKDVKWLQMYMSYHFKKEIHVSKLNNSGKKSIPREQPN